VEELDADVVFEAVELFGQGGLVGAEVVGGYSALFHNMRAHAEHAWRSHTQDHSYGRTPAPAGILAA
jgi:hypothetical protein